MSHHPLRFVHAADFHLEQPPGGVSEVPDHLRELFIESAFWAAERVFETARAQQADFVLLSGDLLDPPRTGPRGPIFLAEQFEKLDQSGIRVYWAGSRIDSPDTWPESVRLPKNVHHFATGRPEELLHKRDGQQVARILGASRTPDRRFRPNDFVPDAEGLFTIAVAHGSADPEVLRRRRIDYWALGGNHGRRTLFGSPQAAHYPGTPQGRRPADQGEFGCTLVDVDTDGLAHLTSVPTQLFRWHHEKVALDPGTQRSQLETVLRERMNAVVASAAGTDVLVSWTVTESGPLADEFRRGVLAGELLEMLRSEFGHGPPVAWSVSLEADSAVAVPDPWYEQESIRGDFLRAVRGLLDDPREPIELEAYLPEHYRAGSLAPAATLSEGRYRLRVLAEAAMLGVDLLSGEESQS